MKESFVPRCESVIYGHPPNRPHAIPVLFLYRWLHISTDVTAKNSDEDS
jgi:hypothetical protein